MKVAVVSESAADEAAIEVLVRALSPTIEITRLYMEPRTGVSSVFRLALRALRCLHIQEHAAALVIVVDSNKHPVHDASHDQSGGSLDDCRLCHMRELIATEQSRLQTQKHRNPVKVAVGLAVP